ncbi:uncharacterized protein LOC119323297 isoform X2 [Triticum dicoccoides]|uniref:uncharacterized protein LOC119323297 isoform X2 n=1 Tax=Triticum dicoccoides TaxID=85692 RepID=UPI001890FEAC|nr:uncharacterized protein LOC119323297 isoform X2 [Triticum dicoccoides]
MGNRDMRWEFHPVPPDLLPITPRRLRRLVFAKPPSYFSCPYQGGTPLSDWLRRCTNEAEPDFFFLRVVPPLDPTSLEHPAGDTGDRWQSYHGEVPVVHDEISISLVSRAPTSDQRQAEEGGSLMARGAMAAAYLPG